MYKVGVIIMGKPSSQASKVKEIVLEVEPKTKLKNLIEYLVQLNKLTNNTQVYFALQKKGRPFPDDSSISQVLKHTRPVNGVIKLFLYEQTEQQSQEKIQLKNSRQELNHRSRVNPQKSKSSIRDGSSADDKKRCCCF